MRKPHPFVVKFSPAGESTACNFYRVTFLDTGVVLYYIESPTNGVWKEHALLRLRIRLEPYQIEGWTALEIIQDLFPGDKGVEEFILSEVRKRILEAAGHGEEAGLT